MPRPRSRPLISIGDHWVAQEPGRPGYYHYWHDRKSGRTRRASLGISNPEQAKTKFAELVVSGAPKSLEDYLSVILEKYFEDRTDGKPSEKQTRNAGRVLLERWGPKIRAKDITEAKQREFSEWCISRGYRLSYVARNLGVLATALRHSELPVRKVITNDNLMRERWGLKDAAPKRRYIPSDAELARLLSAPMPERLFRWIIIQLTTAGRPQTALDLAPEMRERGVGIVHLNPPGRRQNKKFRATIREGDVLSGWLDKWESGGLDAYGGRYCGYETIEGVKTALQSARVRPEVNVPQISTYSFRHKVTTILRMAGVSEDQISLTLGHQRANLRVTGGYGEWSPEYLKSAAAAIDDWFGKLQPSCTRPLFSHGFPTKASAKRPPKKRARLNH